MAALKPVFLDLETYWSATHSLTKMSPIAYVNHPDTELISLAACSAKSPARVVMGEDNIKRICATTDWSDKYVIAHNNEGFDSMVLAWRLGVRPAMWGCTLAMARPHFAKTVGLSLAKLVEHFGLGVKDASALINTKGRHLKDFTPEEIEAMKKYNATDTEQCRDLFQILLAMTPKDELRIIDRTIRMLVEPKFVLDTTLVSEALFTERARKKEMILDVAHIMGVDTALADETTIMEETSTALASQKKFAEFLERCGVEVPMKPSPSVPGKEVPALAKSDQAFLDLQEHDDPHVAAAALARLGVKSTILETRLDAFLQAATAAGGRLPIPTKYYGADTTGRRSGWMYNPLNLPRVSGKPSDALRNSLVAPPGYKVVVADLSGIELRMNHFLWQVPSSMALYQADPEKADLYKEFASALYDVDAAEVTKQQRQVGKVAHLGLGYGAGAATFQKVAKLMGGVALTLDESQDVVTKWRTAYKEIADGWKTCHRSLDAIVRSIEQPIDPWELCWTCEEGIRTPKGMIRYPNLRKQVDEESEKVEWVYGEGRHKSRIYAGKIDENIVQHLSRFVITDAMLKFDKTDVGKVCGGVALEVYDELVYIAPEEAAEEALNTLQSIMRTPPAWFPQLVTWSEGDIADNYGGAKS